MKNTTKNKPSRRRLAQIYTEAAELVGEGKYFYACDAIGRVIYTFSAEEPEAILFRSMFWPGRYEDVYGAWWNSSHYPLWQDGRNVSMEQTPRIIALLLMAELAKDGQLD